MRNNYPIISGNLFLILLFFSQLSLLQSGYAQTSYIKGIVSVNNSIYEKGRKQQLANVEITDSSGRAHSTKTNARGEFLLEFKNTKPGSPVTFNVYYKGYEVVNRHVLAAYSDQTEIVKVAMAMYKDIDRLRAELYEIDIPRMLRPLNDTLNDYRRKISRLTKKTNADQQEIRRLLLEHDAVIDRIDALEKRLKSLAKVYISVNMDDQQAAFVQSFTYFKQGKSDSCLAVIDRFNLDDYFNQLSSDWRAEMERRKNFDSAYNKSWEAGRNMALLKSTSFQWQLKFDSAELVLQKLVAQDTNRAESFKFLADLYTYESKDSLAGINYMKAFQKSKDLYLNYEILNNMSMMEQRLGNFIPASIVLSFALQFREKSANIDSRNYDMDIAKIYAGLAFVQLTQGKPDSLEWWLKKAYDLALTVKDTHELDYGWTMSKIARDRGTVCTRQEKWDAGMRWYNESLSWLNRYSHPDHPDWQEQSAAVYGMMAVNHLEQAKYDSAKSAVHKGLDILSGVTDRHPVRFLRQWSYLQVTLADVLIEQDLVDSGRNLLMTHVGKLKTYLPFTGPVGNLQLSNAYQTLAELAEKNKNILEAATFQEENIRCLKKLAGNFELSHLKFLWDGYALIISFYNIYGPEQDVKKYQKEQRIMQLAMDDFNKWGLGARTEATEKFKELLNE